VIAGGASALSTPLAGMSDAGVQAAYRQISGDIHASLRSAAVEDSRIIRDAVLDHLNAPSGGTGIWAVGFGGYGSIATDGNASGLHHNTAGFVGGADMDVGSGFRLGLGGGYTSNDASTSGRVSTANGNSGHVLGYAGWSDNGIDLKLGGDYGWGTANVTRTVAAYAQTDSGRQDQRTSQVFGEFGYHIGGTPMVPYVDVASISATTGAFAETGGSAALTGAQKTDTQTYSTVGLRVALPMDWVTPRFDIGWQHGFNRCRRASPCWARPWRVTRRPYEPALPSRSRRMPACRWTMTAASRAGCRTMPSVAAWTGGSSFGLCGRPGTWSAWWRRAKVRFRRRLGVLDSPRPLRSFLCARPPAASSAGIRRANISATG
jgi:hypothetical protein